MDTNKNEIDLIELLIKTYLYLIKYSWILLIAIVLGFGFTFLKSKIKEPIYSSSMVIETKTKNNYMYALTFTEYQDRFEQNPGDLIVKIINSANSQIKNGNIQVLADRMGLPKDQINQITNISAGYNYIKSEAISDFVTITVTSSNSDVYKYLGKGINNYINNNEYVKDRYISDSIFLTQVIKRIDSKILELDKIQEKILNKEITFDLLSYNNNSLFAENVMLSSLKEKLTSELKELNQTKIVENFYLPNSTNKSLKSAMIINVAIFIFIGLLVIFFILLNKKAQAYKNQ